MKCQRCWSDQEPAYRVEKVKFGIAGSSVMGFDLLPVERPCA